MLETAETRGFEPPIPFQEYLIGSEATVHNPNLICVCTGSFRDTPWYKKECLRATFGQNTTPSPQYDQEITLGNGPVDEAQYFRSLFRREPKSW